jgi:hypothetical protein
MPLPRHKEPEWRMHILVNFELSNISRRLDMTPESEPMNESMRD